MSRLTDESFIRVWKKWFLREVAFSIAESYSIYYRNDEDGNQLLVIRGMHSTNNSESWTNKKYKAFLNGFRKLCRNHGFDPELEEDHNQYDFNERRAFWSPTTGDFGVSFAKNCYKFYHTQKLQYHDDLFNFRETQKINLSVFSNKRKRLPLNLAKCLLFFIETSKKNSNRQKILKTYLTKSFENDFYKTKSKIIHAVKTRKEFNGINFDEDTTTCKSILKLSANTGDKFSQYSWVNHKRQDLIRLILSEKKSKIIKKLKAEDNIHIKSLITEVLQAGSVQISKH